MRVLYIAEQLDRPEQHLIARLARRGVEARVLLPGDDPAARFLRDAGVSHVPLALRRRYDGPARKEIRGHIRRWPADIVHCLRNNRPLSNTVLAIRGSDAKLVAYRGTMGNLSRLDPASWMTYLNPRVDRVVCVSQGVTDFLRGLRVPARKLVTIHKGHHPDWYAQPPVPRAEIGVPESAFVVGCVAKMRPLKGVDLLVDTLARMEDGPRIHLVLVGRIRDPNLERRIEAYTGDHVIHRLGFREDATRVAGAFNVVAMPSRRREGLPRAVIEAMAQGVPALVTRVGGMPELVRDGVDGVVVEPNSSPALARGLRRLLHEPEFCRRCGEQARERIATDFHIERTVEKTYLMYDDLLRDGGNPCPGL